MRPVLEGEEEVDFLWEVLRGEGDGGAWAPGLWGWEGEREVSDILEVVRGCEAGICFDSRMERIWARDVQVAHYIPSFLLHRGIRYCH